MTTSVRPIPEGYNSVTPGITCKNASEAIEFYKNAFGATELMRMAAPDGKIMHAELQIGDSRIFLGDEWAPMAVAPDSSAPPSSSLFLYVEDVDTVFNRAIEAGGTVTMPVTNMFWGDRYGKLRDPFGHHWGVATHVEDVAPEEMKRRSDEEMAKMLQKASAAQA